MLTHSDRSGSTKSIRAWVFRKLPILIRARRWILNKIRNYILKKEATDEAQRIYSAIRHCKTRVLIVCDNQCTPPTYGDYLYFILLVRFFIAHKVSVDFIIVDSELRADWDDLTVAERQLHISMQFKLADCLINSNLCRINTLSWENTRKYIKKNQHGYIIYSEKVFNRSSVYNLCFNLLNQLLHKVSPSVLRSILFKSSELSSYVKTAPAPNSYVTLHCRYSRKWGLERNLTEQEFLTIHSLLSRQFPGLSIMVISDDNGCSYFEQIALKHMLTLDYSKRHSSSFIGDAFLVLNSAFYFQLRGGGMGIIPTFSFLPFKIICLTVHELMWARDRIACFHENNQVFILGNKLL